MYNLLIDSKVNQFKKDKGPSFRDYLTGALIANLPLIIVIQIMSFFDYSIIPTIIISFILYLLCFFSGLLSGYLVAGKTTMRESYLTVGFITGIISADLYLLVSFIFMNNLLDNLFAFIGYVMGSIIGSKLREKHLYSSSK